MEDDFDSGWDTGHGPSAPEHAGLFDELVAMLRGAEEWRYVDREVDIRLTRAT